MLTHQAQFRGLKMAVTTGSEDAWQRKAYISIESSSTVKLQYEALTETIDIDMGERDLDVINLLNLGQIPKHGSLGIVTITFEGYPLYAGTWDTASATLGTLHSGIGQAYFDIFASVQNVGDTGEQDIDMSNTLTRYRVAVLWTDDPDLSSVEISGVSDGAPPTITTAAKTNLAHAGKILYIVDETAAGSYYMITTNNGTTVFTLTTGDTPDTDNVDVGDLIDVYPTGSGAIDTTSKGMRFVLADCTCTSCKTSFTDGIMKQTLVFKGRAFAKNERVLCKMESATASEVLTALGDYTAGTTAWA